MPNTVVELYLPIFIPLKAGPLLIIISPDYNNLIA